LRLAGTCPKCRAAHCPRLQGEHEGSSTLCVSGGLQPSVAARAGPYAHTLPPTYAHTHMHTSPAMHHWFPINRLPCLPGTYSLCPARTACQGLGTAPLISALAPARCSRGIASSKGVQGTVERRSGDCEKAFRGLWKGVQGDRGEARKEEDAPRWRTIHHPPPPSNSHILLRRLGWRVGFHGRKIPSFPPTPSKAPSSLPGRPQTWQPTPMKSARFTPLVSSAASTSRDGESTGCRDGGRELVCSAGRSVARGASSAGGGPGPPLHPVFCLESPWPIAQVSRSRARQVQGAGVHTPWHPSFTLLRHNQLTPMWHKPTPQGPTLTPRDARTSSTVRAMKGLGVNLQTHGAGVRVGRGRLGLAK